MMLFLVSIYVDGMENGIYLYKSSQPSNETTISSTDLSAGNYYLGAFCTDYRGYHYFKFSVKQNAVMYITVNGSKLQYTGGYTLRCLDSKDVNEFSIYLEPKCYPLQINYVYGCWYSSYLQLEFKTDKDDDYKVVDQDNLIYDSTYTGCINNHVGDDCAEVTTYQMIPYTIKGRYLAVAMALNILALTL